MNLLQEVQKIAVKKMPEIKPGHTVRVFQKIKEGEKERLQVFEGLVIKLNSGYGADKTFTVRKIVEGIGVEKVFPVFSTNIEKVEIKKISKIRRAKLYYMRERFGKSARLKDSLVSSKNTEVEEEELMAPVVEDVMVAEEEVATPEVTTEEVVAEEAAPAEETAVEEAPATEEVAAETTEEVAEEKKEA